MALILRLVLLIMNLVTFIPGRNPVSRAGGTLESENYHEIMAMNERPGWRGYILTGIILRVIGILFLPGSPDSRLHTVHPLSSRLDHSTDHNGSHCTSGLPGL
jgi:hypothetical protein